MFRTIQCDEIDFKNTEYLMSYPAESEKIRASVGMIGVIQPIVVDGCPCSGGYRILAGFRRAYACRQLGISTLNAYLYHVPPENPVTAFWLVLQENASHRAFNAVEKALILTKLLTQFQCERAEVIEHYLPLLDLQPANKVLDIYLRVSDFADPLKAYLAEHDVPMNLLELLGNLAPDDRQAVFALMAELKLGVNKIKELLGYLDDIALRDGQSPAQILQDQHIQQILTDDTLQGPQKAEQIRHSMYTRRYPQFAELEQRYQQALQHLHPPKGVRVQADRYFEDDRLSVDFQVHKPEDLQQIAEQLTELARKPELAEVFAIIQGNGRE